MSTTEDFIIESIQIIGRSNRRYDNIVRRSLKATEELGELAEAALSVTSLHNAKEKEWIDVIEEAVDVAIMGIDIALTKPEGWEITDAEWRKMVCDIFLAKLGKWDRQVSTERTLISEGKLPKFTEEDIEKFALEFSKRF